MAVEELIPVGERIDGIVVGPGIGASQAPEAPTIDLVFVDAGDGEPLESAAAPST